MDKSIAHPATAATAGAAVGLAALAVSMSLMPKYMSSARFITVFTASAACGMDSPCNGQSTCTANGLDQVECSCNPTYSGFHCEHGPHSVILAYAASRNAARLPVANLVAADDVTGERVCCPWLPLSNVSLATTHPCVLIFHWASCRLCTAMPCRPGLRQL